MPICHPPRRAGRCARVALVLSALLVPGCDPPPATATSQAAVAQSWQRADRAVQQAAEAEQQVRHERRLRDIDRLRAAAEVAELTTQTALLRGLALGLALALLATLVGLTVEVRRRRVLTAVVHDLAAQKEVNNAPT